MVVTYSPFKDYAGPTICYNFLHYFKGAISYNKDYAGLTICYNFLYYFERVVSYSSCNLAVPL